MDFWDKLFLHRELFWKLCQSQFNNKTEPKKKNLEFLIFNIHNLIFPLPPSFLPSLLLPFFPSFIQNQFYAFPNIVGGGGEDALLFCGLSIQFLLFSFLVNFVFLLTFSLEGVNKLLK